MATHAPVARVPFAPLDNPRLQHLASAKNRQNGILAQKSPTNGKANASIPKSLFSPTKRPFEPSVYDDNDSENVDPAICSSPSKKSKSDVSEKPFKPFTFTMTPSKSMPPPPTIPSRLSTPARSNMSSPRAPLTAPAGRSPKRKMSSMNKTRRVSAPFGRIDPPFASRSTSSLPFSLDAALNGTFTNSAPKDAGATLQESMPKNWFFEIYEDTPEEEAATFMEHSTLTLDLSSDEESSKSAKDDRGKENTPPEDYDAPTASRPVTEPAISAPVQSKKTDIIRRKVASDEMDDGERSPLSDLETDPFIPEGLDKDSHVIVDSTPEKAAYPSSKLDVASLFATPVPFTSGSTKDTSTGEPSRSLTDMPVVNANGDVKGEIIVWEDSPASQQLSSSSLHLESPGAPSKAALSDENTQPQIDDFVE
ncbi:hypothetical protein LTR37_011961 [Vermiconidia calcicola]|uniref:Uncharacterized protein n=1 Tax=Vermiconidia calcicola TaxID=1690605 RepID=A0ACC3N2J3_9PEZI|nr:hypothetical protein LTR37_011961 [Vermiconidia calcicola]